MRHSMPTHPEFRTFPSSYHFRKINHVKPYKILQIYLKYFFSYLFLKFGPNFCDFLYVYSKPHKLLVWVVICTEHKINPRDNLQHVYI